MLFKIFLSSLAALSMAGCAAGNCRTQANYQKTENSEVKVVTPAPEKIKVYKADGSLQCGMGKAVSLAEMQKELAGVKVHSAANKNDGQMRVQVCGAPTGNCNVYEIDRSQLASALKAGFKEWIYE